MSKLFTLAVFGAGYVLGARAGRERYEQIAAASRRVASDPRVQRASGKAADAAKDAGLKAADAAKDAGLKAAEAAKDGVVSAAGTVAEKVRSDDGADAGVDADPGHPSAAGPVT